MQLDPNVPRTCGSKVYCTFTPKQRMPGKYHLCSANLTNSVGHMRIYHLNTTDLISARRRLLSYLRNICQYYVKWQMQLWQDEVLRDRILFGISDSRVRERLLRDDKLTMAKTLALPLRFMQWNPVIRNPVIRKVTQSLLGPVSQQNVSFALLHMSFNVQLAIKMQDLWPLRTFCSQMLPTYR